LLNKYAEEYDAFIEECSECVFPAPHQLETTPVDINPFKALISYARNLHILCDRDSKTMDNKINFPVPVTLNQQVFNEMLNAEHNLTAIVEDLPMIKFAQSPE
jgi:hypothetical protein